MAEMHPDYSTPKIAGGPLKCAAP